MKALYIVLNLIGNVLFFTHMVLRFVYDLDTYFVLYVSLAFIFFGSFFEGTFLRKKIKKLEAEINKFRSQE